MRTSWVSSERRGRAVAARVLVLLVLILPGAPPAWGRSPVVDRQRLARLLAESPRQLVARIESISGLFLGVAWVQSPLGEGPGHPPDSDPTFRLDAVDCTTLVEQTLALALSVDLEQAEQQLRRLRYDRGRVDYLRRKHFMMAQWVPLNQQAGFLRDITREVGGDRVIVASKELNPAVWQARAPGKPWPVLTPEQVPRGTFSLPVIPLAQAIELAERIPSGTILLVVRDDRANMPVRVTHMGLVIGKPEGPVLRHAARNIFGKVVDEPLRAFLRRISRYRRWPVTGVNLQQLQDPGPQKNNPPT